MEALAYRIGNLLIEGFDDKLEANGKELDGKIGIRYYPTIDKGSSEEGKDDRKAKSGLRLGSHVDGNFFTILWK